MLIELVDGFYFDPVTNTVVKDTGEEQCALFRRGDSAMDGGFTLPCTAGEVAEVLIDNEDGEGEGDGEPDED